MYDFVYLSEADCTLDNIHFYREGAYWNPVQDTHQIGAGCVNCTCSNVSFLKTNSQFYTQLTSFKRRLLRASAPLSSIWREAASCRREIVRKSGSSRRLFERLFLTKGQRIMTQNCDLENKHFYVNMKYHN